MKVQQLFYLLLPLLCIIVFGSLHGTRAYDRIDNLLYDLALHIKPSVQEEESILLLNIDDLSISKVGMWPWSRSTIADALFLLKEFDARYVVFDIEYSEESPLGVNSEYLNRDIPEVFSREFSEINNKIELLANALVEGTIPLSDAPDFAQDLTQLNNQSLGQLLDHVDAIARDNDRYVGNAADFFGHAFFTVNMLPEENVDVPQEYKQYAHDHIPLSEISVTGTWPHTAEDIRPTIPTILSGAAGAGFPNVVIDSDGVRRRINLLFEHDSRYYAQLSFRPLLDWLGNPAMTVSRNRIVLENATLPDGTVETISIPLDCNSRFLINWPKKDFDNSFRILSFYYLVLHKRQLDSLVANLETMEQAGYLSYFDEPGFLQLHRVAEAAAAGEENNDSKTKPEDFKTLRAAFLEKTDRFLNGETEEEIVADIDAVLSMEGLTEEQEEQYRSLQQEVRSFFTHSRELYNNLMVTRDSLREHLPGSFCLIGWTGTGTTDRGVNPFDETYDNVGTHAAVVNTVLQGRFLDELPLWYSILFTVVFTGLLYLISRALKPVHSLITGILFLAGIVILSFGFFLATGIYARVSGTLMAVAVSFVGSTSFKFVETNKEKNYIRSAFGRYLSEDVITEIIDNPDRLALGGDKKLLTAMFTDVKGFSTISESLDPVNLVTLLNVYLTEMSNIVLDLKGTIDKYEGDAIIAFFGAPVPLEDHARRVCAAAINMKKAEAVLNRRFLEEKMTPGPLLTRIGINTGEMVVGNMGTTRKMDYTIMGNSVNLAARLEGVNKQYGTWIIMSESTYDAGGKEFLTRTLDRVRVVGINTPVRLYELIDEVDQVDEQTRKNIDTFHEALDMFERRDWNGAAELFTEVLAYLPEDGPAQTFLKRCTEYRETPPSDQWDGVYNLTSK